MNLKSGLSTILLGLILVLTSSSYAQAAKIGYCRLGALLQIMPELKTMEQELEIYRNKYTERLAIAEKYLEDKYLEYQELISTNPPAITEEEAKLREEELIKLQNELKSESEEYKKVLEKRQENLLTPIIEKVKKAIDEVAIEEGFVYILNAVDASNTTIVLYGPKENDVTEKVAKKLNIVIPKATAVSTPNPISSEKEIPLPLPPQDKK